MLVEIVGVPVFHVEARAGHDVPDFTHVGRRLAVQMYVIDVHGKVLGYLVISWYLY